MWPIEAVMAAQDFSTTLIRQALCLLAIVLHAAWRAGRWSEMTASGTFRTCPTTLTMSVDRGNADLAVGRSLY
jgi:hypothetical protein